MSRIREKFGELKRSGRGAFIPFITAGDPDVATTERLLIELATAGADIIELGVPFSDPVADGEVIQRASERALRNGVTVHDALTCARNVRQHIEVPIVLFSYFNPLLQFGPERFAPAAREAGIDAVLVTDLIPEEAESWDSEPASTSTRSDLFGRANHFGQTARTNRATSARIHLCRVARWRDRRARSNDARC